MIPAKSTCLFNNLKKVYCQYCKKYKSTSPPSISSSLEYCINLVRKLDHENYLCTILLPEHLQAAAFAIRAFNIELSKIQEQAKEVHTGIMRVKFWEDCLNKIYNGKPPNNPVVQEVYKATKRHKLSKLHFKKLVTSRMNQLNVSTFKDLEDMESYADQTCSPVLMLLLEASGVRSLECDHVAAHIGKAQGMCNLIRSLPYNLKEKLVLLPRSELIEHNVSEESLIRNSVDADTMSQIIFKVATKANYHLKVATSLQSKVPANCKSIFLPAVPVRMYLKKLEKHNFYIYQPGFQTKNGLLPFHLFWSKLKNSF